VHPVERIVDIQDDALWNRSKRAAILLDQRLPERNSARRSGRFSSRETVDCEHNSSPEGKRSSASLNIGSARSVLASLPSS